MSLYMTVALWLKRDCGNEQSEEFSGVERKILKSRDILFVEERNQMSMQGFRKKTDICLMEGYLVRWSFRAQITT